MKSEQQVSSTTANYLLNDILEDIERGKLQIPDFQRSFVWNIKDILALYDSILKGYAIGSFVFWETNQVQETKTHLGVHKMNTDAVPTSYIIDGQQRLASLYCTLMPIKNEPLLWEWNIYFDLKREIFQHLKPSEKIPPHYFPLRKLLRTTDFLIEAQKIQDEFGMKADQLVEKAEKLLKKLRNYKIIVVEISGNFEPAKEIFTRINTRGKQLKAQ